MATGNGFQSGPSPADAPLASVQSTLTVPKRGLRYFILRPLIAIKGAIEALYLLILTMMLKELFKRQSHHFTSLQHIVAFVATVGFSLAFYYGEHMEGIAVAVFFGLWAIDRYLHGVFGVWRSERTTLQVTPTHVRWRRLRNSMVVDRAEIPRFEIQSVLFELVNLSADAFGQIDESVWRANLVTTQGGHIPFLEAETAHDLLGRASNLIATLNVPFSFAARTDGSLLSRSSTTSSTPYFGDWVTEREPHRLTLRRSRSIWHAFSRAVREYGILFFVVIMADFLAGFGHLFASLFGGMLGLPQPSEPFVFNLTPEGLIGALTPELTWLSSIELAVATYLLIWGTFKGLRAMRVRLEDNTVAVKRGSRRGRKLVAKEALKVRLVDDPEFRLVFFTESNEALEVTGLEDNAAQELYLHCDAWLRGQSSSSSVRPSV